MTQRRMIVGWVALALLSVASRVEAQGAAAPKIEIKMATLAPQGSMWDNLMRQMDAELRKGTNNEVGFSIYAGGVMGDEPVIAQKLGINQVQAAGFTGVGLGKIDMALRAPECPMLLIEDSQVDKAFAAVGPDLERRLEAKGHVLVGWAHPGMVKVLSKLKIDSHATLKNAKVWVWAGDPIAETMCKVLGCNANPLGLPDVLTSLQTGLIDTVYCPGQGCLALQWYTKTKYLTDINIVHSMGGLILRKDTLAKLSPAHQKLLRDLGQKYMRQLTVQTRTDNEKSVQAMQASGIEKITVTPENLADLQGKAQQVCNQLSGSVIPAELIAKIKAAIQ